MRRLSPAHYRVMPWRNGGGITTEILMEPRALPLAGERFSYRVSIADVTTDGPFSRFEGYDRLIALTSGAGMTLDCGEHGRFELGMLREPVAFSGDWQVHGTLANGPVRDFNLIVDRERVTAALDVREVQAPETLCWTAGSTCILHVLTGEVTVAGAAVNSGDTLVSEDADAAFELTPHGPARIAVCRIDPRRSR